MKAQASDIVIGGLVAWLVIGLSCISCAHFPDPAHDPIGMMALPECREVKEPEPGTFCPKPRMDFMIDQYNQARVEADHCRDIESRP